MSKKNCGLLLLCVAIILSALIIGSKGEFGGADDQIEEKIVEVDKNYKPWFNSIWAPPSGEIESFLFAFQAAAGAGFIGYYIGKKNNVQNNKSTSKKK